MEFVSILLSVLMGVLSPGGLVIDQLVADALRSQVSQIESLDVRIDNTPTWQLVQGKIDHVRIAGRGVYPIPELRIDTLEIESDPIDVSMPSLRQGQVAFDQPVQVGLRAVFREEDVNRLIQSPRILERVRNFGINLLSSPQAIQAQRYSLINPRVTLLDDRLRAEVAIRDEETLEELQLQLESGLMMTAGRSLTLIEPALWVNGEPAPPQLVEALAIGVNRQLDLRSLGPDGVIVRVLDLDVQAGHLETAVFVQVNETAIAAISSGN